MILIVIIFFLWSRFWSMVLLIRCLLCVSVFELFDMNGCLLV